MRQQTTCHLCVLVMHGSNAGHTWGYWTDVQTCGTFSMSTLSGNATQSPSNANSLLIKIVSGQAGDLQRGEQTVKSMPLKIQDMSCYVLDVDLNRTTSPLEYLYSRMLSLSTRTMSLEVEPSGLKQGCMDLPCTEAGPASKSLAVTATGVNHRVFTATLFKKRKAWLIRRQARRQSK